MHTKSCWWRSSFPDAEAKGIEDTTVNVWEDNWDDDAKEDDFANQLRWDSQNMMLPLCLDEDGEEQKAIFYNRPVLNVW